MSEVVLLKKKLIPGFYIGGACIFWIQDDERGRPGLIYAINKQEEEWKGTLPRIDVIAVSPLGEENGEIILAENIPYVSDVEDQLRREFKPPELLLFCPRFALIESMVGI